MGEFVDPGTDVLKNLPGLRDRDDAEKPTESKVRPS